MHNGRGDLVDIVLLLLGEAQHVEGLLLSEERLRQTSARPSFSRQRRTSRVAKDHLILIANENNNKEKKVSITEKESDKKKSDGSSDAIFIDNIDKRGERRLMEAHKDDTSSKRRYTSEHSERSMKLASSIAQLRARK